MKYSARPNHYAPHKRSGISSKNAPHSKVVAQTLMSRLNSRLRAAFTLAGHK